MGIEAKATPESLPEAIIKKMADYRLESNPPTTKMLNRSAKQDCPLCQVWGIPWDANNNETWNKQHIYAEALWNCWNPEKRNWPEDVCLALAALPLGLKCTNEQARRHYRYHRPEQPYISNRFDRERDLSDALDLSSQERAVILTVYRQRFLSGKQAEELFFKDGDPKKTSATLVKLARLGFLYRYYPDSKISRRRGAPPSLRKEALWFLGKRSVALIESTLGVKVWPGQYVKRAGQVDENMIIHDLRLNELVVQLDKQIKKQGKIVELPDGRIAPSSVLVDNWYSDRHLAFGFFDRLTQQSKEVSADTFATISLKRPSFALDDIPSCQLPFFIEYDRGSKVYRDVANQLVNYHLMAAAEAVGKRFPDLECPGYSVPVIMIFSDSKRLTGIQKSFRDIADQLNISQGAPVFLASEEEWLANPLTPDIIISAWHGDTKKFGLIDLLLRSSKPLIQNNIVTGDMVLTVDPQGARRTSGGGVRASTLAGGRQKLEQKRKESREESELTETLDKAKQLRQSEKVIPVPAKKAARASQTDKQPDRKERPPKELGAPQKTERREAPVATEAPKAAIKEEAPKATIKEERAPNPKTSPPAELTESEARKLRRARRRRS